MNRLTLPTRLLLALPALGLAAPILLPTPLAAQNPLARPKAKAEHPFSGRFAGEGLSLELVWLDAKSRYTGTLTVGEAKYDVEATERRGVLDGSFTSEGTKFTFTVQARGAKFVLTSDGVNHDLDKKPLVDSPVPGQTPPPAAPAPATGQGGVGIAFQPQGDTLVIAQLAPGGAAEKAKVPVGAVLRAVDGKRIAGLPLETVGNLVRGPVGSYVTLTLETEREVLDVILQRAPLPAAPGQPGAPAPAPEPRGLQPGAGPAPGPAAGPGLGAPDQPAATGDLPAWLAVGMRATYFGGSATMPGSNSMLTEDDQGNWVDPQGRRYRQEEVQGSGGGGFTQYDFVHVAPDAIAVACTSFVFADAQLQTVQRVAQTAYLGDRNGLGDVWIHPAKLRAMREEESPGHRVRRLRYPLGDRTYDALTVQDSSQGSYIRYTYDLDTGLMLVHSASSVGKQVMTPNPNGTASVGAGSTTITHGHLRQLRPVKLPWTGQRAPQWLQRGQQLHYAGTYRNTLADGVMAPWRYEFSVAIERTFGDGAFAKLGTLLDYGTGQPPQQGQSDNAYGPGSVVGLWLDPRSVQDLRPGQVLDRDPVTGWQLSFVGNDGQTATILEQGPLESQSYTYDLRSGQLVASSSRQKQGPATLCVDVQLAR